MSGDSNLSDLRRFVDEPAPFVTVGLPTPSELDDAQHRFEVSWKNALSQWPADWPADELDTVAALVPTLPHDGGASLVIAQSRGGAILAEFLDEPLRDPFIASAALPCLATIIESRQRARPHIVVEVDRAGADLHVFDGGQVLGSDHVEGDTLHIHRGHPGGWSQRRFQQRAENTWERNADNVAAAVVEADERVRADLVFVAGDVRAQSLVIGALPPGVRDRTVKVEAGSPDGIADDVVRHLADHVAREIRGHVDELRAALGTGTASLQSDEVLSALEEGRVQRLLVHDDGTGGTDSESTVDAAVGSGQRIPVGDDGTTEARLVDVAIAAALRTDAAVTVVPDLAVLEGPIAALLRW